MDIREIIRNYAIADKAPFDLDIQPEPWEGPFATVGRFQLARYDELLTRESWFFEIVAQKIGQRRIELQIEIFSFAKLIKEEFQLEKDADALKILSGLMVGKKTPEQETEEERKQREALEEQEQTFLMKHLDRFTKLADMANAATEGAVESWMRITFFLLSRYDANWNFSKTASLRKSEIDALLKFIAQEANGGVPLEEQSEEEDLGKQLSLSKQPELASAPTGTKSSGKLTRNNTSETSASTTATLPTSPPF